MKSYMRIPVFITVISTFVTIVDYTLKAYTPLLSRSLGVFVLLIVVNCAVLAAAFLAIDYELDLLRSIVYTLRVSLGYFFALVMFAGIRERIDLAPVSKSFKGYPIAFITASLMSLAFLGFKGLFGL